MKRTAKTATLVGFFGLLVLISCRHQAYASSIVSVPDPGRSKVLIVLSGSDHVTTKEGTLHRTGFFLSELAGPALALRRAGFDLIFATPSGIPAAMDPVSDSVKWFKTQAEYQEARQYVQAEPGIRHPDDLDRLAAGNLDEFAGVMVPGGHAPLEDLSRSPSVARVLRYFHSTGKTTGLICHGPAALLSAIQGENWPYQGYKMTGFSTAEEKQEEDAGHLDGHMPYYLDAALASAGGLIITAQPWQSNAIRDRELITGQNPMSEHAFTALLLEALVARRLSTQPIVPVTDVDHLTIFPEHLYSIAEVAPTAATWMGGYSSIWVGSNSGSVAPFLTKLKEHVSLTWKAFKDQGLIGYLVFASNEYEIAFLHWTNKSAADRAFASVAGSTVAADAGTFMKPVLFETVGAESIPLP